MTSEEKIEIEKVFLPLNPGDFQETSIANSLGIYIDEHFTKWIVFPFEIYKSTYSYITNYIKGSNTISVQLTDIKI